MIGLRNGRSGFTLIELMVVIIILGILAAIAIPKYMVARDRARATEAIQEIGVLAGEIQAQYQITGPEGGPENLTDIGYDSDPFTNGNFSYSFTAPSGGIGDPILTATSRTTSETITLNLETQEWGGTHPGAPQGKL